MAVTGCRIPRQVTPFTWTDVVRDEPLRGARCLSRASSGGIRRRLRLIAPRVPHSLVLNQKSGARGRFRGGRRCVGGIRPPIATRTRTVSSADGGHAEAMNPPGFVAPLGGRLPKHGARIRPRSFSLLPNSAGLVWADNLNTLALLHANPNNDAKTERGR